RLSFEKRALLFDLDGDSHVPESINGVVVTRVGRADIDDLLARARTPAGTEPFAGRPTIVGLPAKPPARDEASTAADADDSDLFEPQAAREIEIVEAAVRPAEPEPAA